jgi:hypothetical protein
MFFYSNCCYIFVTTNKGIKIITHKKNYDHVHKNNFHRNEGSD